MKNNQRQLYYFLMFSLIVKTVFFSPYLLGILPQIKKELTIYDSLFSVFFIVTLNLVLFCFLLLINFISTQENFIKTGIILLIETACSFLLLIDFKVFIVFGVHIFSEFVMSGFWRNDLGEEVNVGTSTYISLIITFIVILIVFIAMNYFSSKFIKKDFKQKYHKIVIFTLSLSTLVISTVIFAQLRMPVIHQNKIITDAIPFYSFFYTQNGQKNLTLKDTYYPHKWPTIAETKKKNIIFIMVETFRGDYVNKELTPEIYDYYQNKSTIRSKFHHSGGHETVCGSFASLYGLNAYHKQALEKIDGKSLPIELLKQNGYYLKGISANHISPYYTKLGVLKQFDEYSELIQQRHLYRRDRAMVNEATSFIKKSDTQPYFLFLFIVSSHHNYDYPASLEIDKPVLPYEYNHFQSDEALKKSKNMIINRYRNSLRYVDSLFKDILDSVPDKENTIIVLTGDHGEEFFEKGFFGHGKSYFINERTQVPLLLYLPDETNKKDVLVSSSLDIFPTIFDYMGLDKTFPANRYTDGTSLLHQQEDYYAFISGNTFPFRNNKFCIIHKDRKYSFIKSSSFLQQFTLEKSTDLNDENTLYQLSPVLTPIFNKIKVDMLRFLDEDKY